MPVSESRTRGVRSGLGVLSGLVKLVMWLIVAVLVLHVVFTLGGANPANWLAALVANLAQLLNLGLDSLFALPDPTLTMVLNYAIIAAIWLVIGSLVTAVLRRIS